MWYATCTLGTQNGPGMAAAATCCTGCSASGLVHALQVQLREQDFGNFQDQEGKKREKAERMRYGRFFYRCAL